MLAQTRYWPQADRLENVIATVRAVSGGYASDEAIGTALGAGRGRAYASRQGRYYRLASEILGFTRRIRKNVSRPTLLGRKLLRSDKAQQRKILTRQILTRQVFQNVLGILAASGNQVSRRELESTIASLANTTPGMARRRLRTIIAWLEYLKIARSKNEKVILQKLPISVNKIEIGDPEVPVLPKQRQMKLFREVSRRKMKALGFLKYEVDATRRERADATHERLRTLLARRIRRSNVWPTYNDLVDLAARIDNQDFIIEVKSRGKRVKDQVRKGISQLYEYRYLEGLPEAKLVLLIETAFSGKEKWLLDYLVKDRGIYVVWDATGDKLFTTKEGRENLPFMR